MNYEYAVVFSRDRNGTVIAEVPDLPGTMTVGKDRAEALERVQDALLAILAAHVREGRPVPRPSRIKRRQSTVPVPARAAAKLALRSALLEQGLTQTALARKLRSDPKQVRRLLDLEHYSRLEQVEKALAVLGKQLVVNVRNAA